MIGIVIDSSNGGIIFDSDNQKTAISIGKGGNVVRERFGILLRTFALKGLSFRF